VYPAFGIGQFAHNFNLPQARVTARLSRQYQTTAGRRANVQYLPERIRMSGLRPMSIGMIRLTLTLL
jgi:hypothetical protein